MPTNAIYEPIESWACEAGCGWSCVALEIETSPSFLRIKFLCRICQGIVIRYYDLEKRGYVAMGNVPTRHFNNFTMDRKCKNMMECPRRGDFSKLLRQRDLIEDNIDAIARIVPQDADCRCMDDKELIQCFHRLFNAVEHGHLLNPFRVIYRTTHAEAAMED
jgi:hypothetical protein